VNAVCPQGDPIRDQIRSVALIIIDGNSLCSGALINNSNNDGTPLFLSAAHCSGTPGTLIFWFNWQSATCTNPGTSPSYNSMTGAVQRALWGETHSDFWLLQLNQAPPAEYNVYYSGWNRTTDASLAGTVWSIHHPSGDIKKISWATGGITTSAYLGNTGSGTTHWRVLWSDETTTEPGSSGSPLLDPQFRIIGQLHGGYAACNVYQPDWYGKLGVSWTGGGTDATRLSTWLDPAGTGTLTLNGFDPNLSFIDGEVSEVLSPEKLYGDTIEIAPEIVIRSAGTSTITAATVSYRIDSEMEVSTEWTGNLTLNESDTIQFDTIPLGWGTHTFIARITTEGDENLSNDSIVFEFDVLDCYNQTLPLTEGFNDTILPSCWDTLSISGSDGLICFIASGTHPSCMPVEGSGMIEFNSFTASIGSEVRLVSPGISTISLEDIQVSLKWFHDANYSLNEDKVIIQYSLDGTIWNNVQEILRYDAVLSGWQNYSIPLPVATENKALVLIGFLFHSGKGNNCHLDSISITGTITGPYCDFTADPLAAYVTDTITFSDASLNGPFTTWEWNFGYGATPQTALGQGPHEVTYNIPGKKSISLLVDDTYSRTKVNYVTISPINFLPPSGLFGFVDNDRNIMLLWDLNYFFDGFESGDFSLWNEVIEGPGTPGLSGYAHWYVQSDSAQYIFEGLWSNMVNWGYDIDTWIISEDIPVSDLTLLSFIWSSSYYWHVDPFDHGDLFVKVSDDSGSTWETLWTFGEIGPWDSWAWYQTIIDLSEFSGSTVQIAFNLAADDNADVAMDNVLILSETDKSVVGTKLLGKSLMSDAASKTLKSEFLKTDYLNPMLPYKGILSSYTIFRNGHQITQTSENTYLDEGLKPGVYRYYVVANYIDPTGTSGPSNEIEIYLEPDALDIKTVHPSVILYPNPSSGIFSVSVDKDYFVSVMNINGIKVGEFSVHKSTKSIDLSAFGKGIYLLQFQSDNDSFVMKVVVQ
jgi:hypothetical protein